MHPVAPPLADLSPPELAAIANAEHEAGAHAAAATLQHWMRAGDALLVAKEKVPYGAWTDWLVANFNGQPETAKHYVRLAWYRSDIEGQGFDSLQQARDYLRGLPAISRAHTGKTVATPSTVQEARRLKQAGMSFSAVGRLIGVSSTTVRRWLDPGFAKGQRESQAKWRKERQADAAAARRRRRDDAVRKSGGEVAKAYAALRKTAQALDQAVESTGEPEVRAALNVALGRVHSAEDEIVKALGVERGRTVGLARRKGAPVALAA